MKKIKIYAFKKPVIFSIVLVIVAIAFTSIPMDSLFSSFFDDQSSEYATGIFEQVMVSLTLIMVLKRFGLLKSAGFTCASQWKDLWIIWPMLPFALFVGSDLIGGNIIIDTSKPIVIILFILTYLSTGLFEETLCRGIVLTLMLRKLGNTKKGLYVAVIISSGLFGLSHIIHYFLGHASLLATFTQITYATFIGVFFAACVLRNKTIYPVMIFHGVLDICSCFNEVAIGGGINKAYSTMSIEVALILIIIALPLFIYGLFIIRKVTPADLFSHSSEKSIH